MKIQYFTPSPALRDLIKSYYLVEATITEITQDTFFADGCPEIVFNQGLDFYRNDKIEPWAKVIGQITDPLTVQAKGQGKSFGIWFHPHGFSMISDIPAKELTNTAIALDSVFPVDLLEFIGECLAGNKIIRLIHLLNERFERMVGTHRDTSQAAIARFVIKELSQNTSGSSLADIAALCNITPRYLQRIFADKIGLRPKQLQRIMRFQHTLSALTTTEKKELTRITYDAGYCDQSHFIREFRQFTNMSPSGFNARDYPINSLFLSSM